MKPFATRFESVYVENVTVPASRARAVDSEAVKRLADSMTRIGLQTPISVRMAGDDLMLVAGLHRLEAARALGWEKIEAVHVHGDDVDARLWEIAENLHRADLSALERAEHVAEWVKLVSAKLAETPRAGRPGAVAAASRELGVSESDARRAAKVAKLTEEAKQEARAVGIDDNRSALLRAAAEPNPAAQLAAIRREAEVAEARKANADTDKLVKERRVEAVKEWLAARLDVTEAHTLGEMLAGICDPLSRALMREAA